MNVKKMKILWFIVGIVLVFAGLIALITPETTLKSIAYIIAIAILITGAGHLFLYFVSKEFKFASSWILVEAILSFVIGLWVMFNTATFAAMLPVIFGFWLIIISVQRISLGLDIRSNALGTTGNLGLLVGVIGIILGILMMFNPGAGQISVAFLIGLDLIFIGTCMVSTYYITKDI